MTSTYTYSQLASDGHSIRLLTLHPGSASDDIKISIYEVRLGGDESLEYEALSYVWGSTENPTHIEITNQTSALIPVTSNLASALRHLRNQSQPRVLWIDAICIDQTNPEERGRQVAIMHNIYRFAKRVIVWFGPEADGSDLAMSLVNGIGSKIEIDWVEHNMKPSSLGLSEPHWADQTQKLPLDDAECSALEHFIDRAWFERLWVVQEVRLANSETLCMCGSSTVKWAALRNAIYCLHQKNIRKRASRYYTQRLLGIQDTFDPTRTYTIAEYLHLISRFKCSDARDRVYAILSVVQDSLNIIPDYTLSTAEVYEDVARRCIEHSQSLNVLTSCDIARVQPQWPTWVPNWSVAKETSPIGNSSAAEFVAVDAKVVGKGVLQMACVRCATITKTTKIHIADHSMEWKALVGEMQKLVPSDLFSASYRSGCSLLQAFCGTLICDQFPVSDPPRADLLNMSSRMKALRRFVQGSVEDKFDAEYENRSYAGLFHSYAKGRSFMLTHEGYIGLAPASAEEGDIVVVPLGCSSPIVLRPSTKGYFQVVGECFVFGLTYGEALLGPQPDDFEVVLRYHDVVHDIFLAFRSKTTGTASWEDPRLRSLGLSNGVDKNGLPNKINVGMLTNIGLEISYLDII